MSKRGENIYKRKDNRWEARYKVGKTSDGKIKFGYCYGKTYGEVKVKLERAKSSVLSKRTLKQECDSKFSDFIDDWFLIYKNKMKDSTIEKYENIIKNHIKPFLGNYNVEHLSSVLIAEFSNELQFGKNLSPKTVKDILVLLRTIIKFASKSVQGLENIEIRYPKIENTEVKVLSSDEQRRLVNYLMTDMDDVKFGILFALMTGLRIGEICALKWKNVSIENETVTVTSTMQRLRTSNTQATTKTTVNISSPKSQNSYRIIPLTNSLLNLCKQHKRCPDEAFILTGVTNRYIEPRTLQNRLKKYAFDLDIKDIHFHILRHTFATRCVEVGFEIKSLSEILGHSSTKVTLERYVHSSLELKRSNMNKLAIVGF